VSAPTGDARDGVDALFRPESIAIVGASENIDRISGRLLYYLERHGYANPIYPINPRRNEVRGLTCYPSLLDVPEPIDLVLVMLAAEHSIDVIRQAGQIGARAAVVYGSGFAETGPEGESLQEQLSAAAREEGVRVLGPNCQGVINLAEGVAASFTRSLDLMPLRAGSVAYLGQSGALGGSVLNLAQERGLGFSAWVSTGNQADLDVLDLAEVLVEDQGTQVFAVYLETLPDGERYRLLARKIRQAGKHLIVLRSGRSEAGQRAVTSHTGAMLSPGVAFELASKREGAILVDDVDELIDAAFMLSAGPVPEGKRVGIVTSSGGAGILAADRCEMSGLEVPELPAEIQDRLETLIPPFGALANPVDVTAQLFSEMDSGRPELFREVCLAVGKAVDILVVTLTMLTGDSARRLAEDLVAVGRALNKPLLIAWLVGDKLGEPAKAVLAKAGLPVFSSPGAAVSTIAKLVGRRTETSSDSLRHESEQPIDLAPLLAKRVILEGEGMDILETLGIPYPPGQTVTSAAEAAAVAEELGDGLAFKVQSPDLLHKTDVGGVRLGVAPEDAPRVYEDLVSHIATVAPHATVHGVLVQAMAPPGGQELILGVTQDPAFGPLLTLGFGGAGAEIYRDVLSEVLPLSHAVAYDLLESLTGAPLLKGYRGRPPADIEALVGAVCRIADAIGASGDRIEEFEINPLIVYPEGEGVLAVDLLIWTTPSSE
jgi:acetate---CoA ligase (ADP-forming)